jgi:inner membrane protein
MLGHRGFFHSPFFALVLAILFATACFRQHRSLSRTWWKYVALFFLVGASHGVLDAFTNGGLGVALLAPFSGARFFSPWRPIPVAPIGIGAALGGWGARVIGWEIVHLWVPAFAALAVVRVVKHRTRRASRS